jgi:hypothetical protein
VTNVSCSDANYQPSAIASPILGIFDRPHIDGRGLLLDASCVAHHAANPAPCYDGAHVLVHHVSTPHLIVADRNDPKVKTTELTYAGNGALGWPPGTQAYAKRVLELARDIERYHATAKREEGALPARSVGIFLRNGNRTGNPVHVFTGLDERMNLAMTPCNAAGTQVGASHTVGEVFRDFGDPAALPDPFLVEDPNDAAGTFWLSGSQCGAGPQ